MTIQYTSQFKKDFKRIQKQNKDIAKLRLLINKLASGKPLADTYRNHQLTGRWKGHRDCHIEPDWILIYRMTTDTLTLERTGSHSELFK